MNETRETAEINPSIESHRETKSIDQPTGSISQQMRFHKQKIAETTEAQKRLEIMKSYGVEEGALADQHIVVRAHQATEEHMNALENLSLQKKQQNAKRMGVLKSVLHFFKLG